MKKILAVLCLVAMLLTTLIVSASAADDTLPALIITALSCDQEAKTSGKEIAGVWDAENNNGADPFEFIRIKNTTNAGIDLYDGYALGYNGSAGSENNAPTKNFRRQVTETTFIGKDFKDGSKWDDTKVKATNPDAAVLAAGAEAYLWMFSMDSYKIGATVEQFRNFWGIPADALVVVVDADSSGDTGADGNFNMKNSATGTYMILNLKGSTEPKFAAESVLKPNAGQVKLVLDETKTIDDLPEVVSYAVVNYDKNEVLKQAKTDKKIANYWFEISATTVSAKLYDVTATKTAAELVPEQSAGTTNPEVTTEASGTTADPTVTTKPTGTTKPADKPSSPSTGDSTVAVLVALLAASAGAVLVLKKKRD